MENLDWTIVSIVASVAITIVVIYCYLRFVAPDFREKDRKDAKKKAEKALKERIAIQETLKYNLIEKAAEKKIVELDQDILDLNTKQKPDD